MAEAPTLEILSCNVEGEIGNKNSICLVRCGCGRVFKALRARLDSGNTRSCGCFRDAVRKETKNKKHGHMARHIASRTYVSWKGMKARCSNPNGPDWKLYGGRGIIVCDKWNDFEEFLKDMGERPPNTTLDRINTDGNYEPGNCRWATAQEQSANRRGRKG